MFLERKPSIIKITIVTKLIYAILVKIIKYFNKTWHIVSKVLMEQVISSQEKFLNEKTGEMYSFFLRVPKLV